MASTSFWQAPNRVTPSENDRLGLQRGSADAGEHITLAQIRDLTYAEVSNLTEIITLAGTEEFFVRDGTNNRKVLASTLIGEPDWVTFPLNTSSYGNQAGLQPLRYKKSGNRVMFQGACVKVGTQAANSSTARIGTLPAGFRPTGGFVKLQACLVGPYKNHNINIDTDGSVYIILQDGTSSLTNGLELSLSSCFFYTD